MLETLHIRNFALIDNLNLTFTEGLNILSGETGAGKSILIGAISLILGVRGDSSLIRTGSKETAVTAVVRIPDDLELKNWLSEHGVECEDNSIIIKRIVRSNGRGSIYIQSGQMTLKDLQYISKYLFDMHGQHEHQSILYEETQRKLLDSYGNLNTQVIEYGANYEKLKKLERELETYHSSERETLREKDMLEYAVREINLANLYPEEENELQEELQILTKSEQLTDLVSVSSSILQDESAPGVLSLVKSAQNSLSEALVIDSRLEQVEKKLENSLYELEDVYDFLRQYRESVNFSPERIDAVQERMQLIRNLKRKYGNTVSDVLEYNEQAAAKLLSMETQHADRDELEKKITELEIELAQIAGRLSHSRKITAEQLGSGIKQHLAQLGMPQAEFSIDVLPAQAHAYGVDSVNFKISPNVGEPPKSLKGIASGGELSRIMLAVKTVLSENDTIDTLIFDEIDSGIGGTVAAAVGIHLGKLAQKRQVLCITHLASIAAKADTHFSVYKLEENSRTITEVRKLDNEEKVTEIARMLSGNSFTDTAIAHARDLLASNL